MACIAVYATIGVAAVAGCFKWGFDMRHVSTVLLVWLITGMGLAGGALIVSVPPLFGPHGQSHVWITGTLAGVFLAFTAGTRYLRPTPPPR